MVKVCVRPCPALENDADLWGFLPISSLLEVYCREKERVGGNSKDFTVSSPGEASISFFPPREPVHFVWGRDIMPFRVPRGWYTRTRIVKGGFHWGRDVWAGYRDQRGWPASWEQESCRYCLGSKKAGRRESWSFCSVTLGKAGQKVGEALLPSVSFLPGAPMGWAQGKARGLRCPAKLPWALSVEEKGQAEIWAGQTKDPQHGHASLSFLNPWHLASVTSCD